MKLAWPMARLVDGRPPVISNPYKPPRHLGVDIVYQRRPQDACPPRACSPRFYCPQGTVAYAPAQGRVARSYQDPKGGWLIFDHGHGLVSALGHLERRDVAEGAAVAAGDPVGLVGFDPRHGMRHIHLEVNFQGKKIDPTPLLKLVPAGGAGDVSPLTLRAAVQKGAKSSRSGPAGPSSLKQTKSSKDGAPWLTLLLFYLATRSWR